MNIFKKKKKKDCETDLKHTHTHTYFCAVVEAHCSRLNEVLS